MDGIFLKLTVRRKRHSFSITLISVVGKKKKHTKIHIFLCLTFSPCMIDCKVDFKREKKMLSPGTNKSLQLGPDTETDRL